MYKISLILPLTLLLVFNVTSGTPEEDGCWSCLERTLNKICKKEGGTSVHTVDFANCKVNCWKPFFGTPSSQQMTLPPGTRCGFPYKVSCWNAINGCAFSGSCMDVLQHFEQDCGFHSTSCPNCDALVLRDNIIEHLKSTCTARVIQVVEAATSTSTSGSDQRAYLEMKQLLEKIRDDHLYLQTSFNRLSEQAKIVSARQHESYETGVTRVVELIRELETGLKTDLEARIVSCKTDVSSEVSKLNGSLSIATEKVSRYVRLSSAPREQIWVLEDWRNMTDGALRGTPAVTESPLRSVRGYSVSQVVKMAVDASHVLRFTSYIRFHSGPIDDELEWPFRGVLNYRVVHPKDNMKTITIKEVISRWSPEEYFGRPGHGPNSPYLLYDKTAESLENAGFIVNDKLRLSILS